MKRMGPHNLERGVTVKSMNFSLSRSALFTFFTLVIWIMLPVGIFLIINENAIWGVIMVAAAIAVIVIATNRRIMHALGSRSIPKTRGYFMMIGSVGAAVLMALYSILLTAPMKGVSFLGNIHAIGIVLFTAWAAIQLLKSIHHQGI